MAFQMYLVVVMLLLQTLVDGQQGSVHSPPDLPPLLDPLSCPKTYESHPLILVSVDGFRAEYLTRGLTPTIEALGRMGLRAPYMKPSFPTITFPNHYTIVTGLYPPYHGIIANKFYDPVLKAEFRAGRSEFFEQRFWGGEPIWKTVRLQGKKSATFFWPGSETDGNTGDYWIPYNKSVPFQHRVDQVLDWLDLPAADRPSFVSLYMHEPDTTGHRFGPNSNEMTNALVFVDSMIKRLVEGLKARNLLSCVNLLVVADHGMADAGDDKTILLDAFIPDLKNRTRFWHGAFVRMQPNDESKATKMEMMEALSCKLPVMRVYEKTTLPIRFHIGSQRRVEDIVVDVDPGYSVGGDASFRADAGEHGYDNFFPVMNAMFLAYGPDFQNHIEVEAFQNIELYNLMCHLLDVKPAPNNGTWGALHHILAHPPPSPLHPGYESLLPVAGLPRKEDIADYLGDGNCEGDQREANTGEWVNSLSSSQKNVRQLLADHLPWGLPRMGPLRDSALLMAQPDFLTAYSTALKMPLWTSFTVSGSQKGSRPVRWRSDIRLGLDEMIPCSSHDALRPYNITRLPLFPPVFSSNEGVAQLAYLMSNAVPASNQLIKRWKQLLLMVTQWSKWLNQLNVIVGPVFDYDSNTFADDYEFLKSHQGIKVPTHLFMVISRCLVNVNHISECPHTHVDTLAFVFPQSLAVPNCLKPEKFAQEFIAKVQDVEKITGLEFFSNMRYDDRVRLAIRMHSNIWGKETWWNRLRTNFYDIGK
ncbi:venom phosphodiesterase-like [Macrobrachium rosenbergii]|uniref:venom phosphodiesterase-like n=1 Tax=Macrobrachium rosenbergii TaxID=79674 RepID=UPI0034D63BA5